MLPLNLNANERKAVLSHPGEGEVGEPKGLVLGDRGLPAFGEVLDGDKGLPE